MIPLWGTSSADRKAFVNLTPRHEERKNLCSSVCFVVPINLPQKAQIAQKKRRCSLCSRGRKQTEESVEIHFRATPSCGGKLRVPSVVVSVEVLFRATPSCGGKLRVPSVVVSVATLNRRLEAAAPFCYEHSTASRLEKPSFAPWCEI